MPEPINDIDKAIKDRFLQLPKVVQDAITSADIEKRLRELATIHKLHLDQWENLENEVTMALLGIERVEDLESNIITEIGIDPPTAHSLAVSINAVIFEPIRQDLERTLQSPEAKVEEVTDTEETRAQILAESHEETTPMTPVVQPATPPPPAPDVKIARPSESTAYQPGQASTERKNIVDDPYREPAK